MTTARAPRAYAVVDLGFGDAGKGLLTDWLTRKTGAGVVVRFNGGAQAGHNVVTDDGREHTFAQFGAGSFVPGVRTFLARDVIVHPSALVREAEVLAAVGVQDALERLAVSSRALLVTPFHQAANRLRELARGGARHGSCGVGIGETVREALEHPDDAPRAGDLRELSVLRAKLALVRTRLAAQCEALRVPRSPAAEAEREIFSTPAVAERWLARCAPLARCVAPDELLAAWLASTAAVVFEGAQGVLLDESLGFHPHTTWSRCTPEGARELLAEAAPGAPLRVYGVLRAHAVRHGPGPMPSEEPALGRIVAEHNDTNPWQGPVRYGWFDAVLARYALACVPELDALAVTHVDALARRETWSACAEYAGPRGDDDLVLRSAAGRVTELVREPRPSLARQERLGRLLGRCRPELRAVPGRESDYLASLEQRLGRRIDLVSRGPRARDVEELAGADVLS